MTTTKQFDQMWQRHTVVVHVELGATEQLHHDAEVGRDSGIANLAGRRVDAGRAFLAKVEAVKQKEASGQWTKK